MKSDSVCDNFVCISKEQRLKIDDRATPCIFVGYRDAALGYKL